jgi:hypothetical protein
MRIRPIESIPLNTGSFYLPVMLVFVGISNKVKGALVKHPGF